MIRLSRDDFGEMRRLISVGKLLGGLIHNLNGPLQNLSMDMDMIGFSMQQGNTGTDELLRDIRTRLGRMEQELERINRLIRVSGARISPDDDETGYMNLDDFLREEIAFLDANLYFKHRVKKEIALDGDFPSIRVLARGTAPCLRGFLESFVEEMERMELGVFSLKGSGNGSGARIHFYAGEAPFPDSFTNILRRDLQEDTVLEIAREQVGIAQAALLFHAANITPLVESGPQGTHISLSL